ncbi:MAG: leucine-rich repeat protein, partial [Treponema sp.]|nr:leucine-rich repeat protein [Treponema sp.]
MAIYTVSPSELDATLASAPANTVDTPHIINLTFINTYTVSNVTVKTALQNNPSKFVSLTILRCDDYGIDTSYMLNACTSLIAVDVSLCKIGNCTAMFSSCNNLRSVKIGLVGLISSVNSSCNYMFQGCSSLTEIIGIRCAATRNPCYWMFQNCSSLKEINLSNFKVSYSESMFEGCSSLETIVLGDQTGVTTAVKMFKDCTSLEEIHGWSIPLTATMTDCFTNCDSLQAIYVPEVIPQESTWHAWEMSKDTVNSQTAVKVYDLDGTSVSVNVPSTGTYSIKVTDKVDELIFASTAGTIMSVMIQKMLQIKVPITGRESALDPTNDNFVLWAKNQQAIKTNIVTNTVEANNPLPPSSAAVHAAI